jgi:hypothetical protein
MTGHASLNLHQYFDKRRAVARANVRPRRQSAAGVGARFDSMNLALDSAPADIKRDDVEGCLRKLKGVSGFTISLPMASASQRSCAARVGAFPVDRATLS